MSLISAALTNMVSETWYSRADVARLIGRDEQTAGVILNELTKGGILEANMEGRYKKSKRWRSKQKELFR